MSRFRARPRKNGYDIDIKAPDGFLLGGWRRICRGGFVRFHGSRWRHPDMIGREGEYVFLHVDCHMACDASFAFEDEPRLYWTPPTNIEGRGRRVMVCDDASEDVRLAQDAAGWYSQAQLEEIARKETEARPPHSERPLSADAAPQEVRSPSPAGSPPPTTPPSLRWPATQG